MRAVGAALLILVAGCEERSPNQPSPPPAPLTGFVLTGDPAGPSGATWAYQATAGGVTYDLQGILFKPAGNGPFPAVIVSHGAAIPLAGRRDVLRVLVTASVDTRVRRTAQAGRRDAAAFIEQDDEARADYFQRFYDIEAELPTHYDVVINTDALTTAQAAAVIVATAQTQAE